MSIIYIDAINGSDTFQTVSISGATKANPCVITSNAHGLDNGQRIRITSVSGMTQLNGNVYKIANVAANTFELQNLNGTNIDSTAFSTYTSGGTATIWRKMVISGITKANPAVVTAKKHGFTNGQVVIIEGVGGMTEVNDKVYTVANKTTDTFELSGINSSSFTTYTSGGTVHLPFGVNGVNTLTSSTVYGGAISPQNSFVMTGDTIRLAKTLDYSSIAVGSGNIVFTKGSTSVTTSVDLTGSLSAGNFIGLVGARLDGCASDPTVSMPDQYYRIDAINSSGITLNSKYCGSNTTVSSVNRLRIDTEIRQLGTNASPNNSTACAGIIYEGGYDLTTTNTTIARNTSNSASVFRNVSTSDAYFWQFADTGSTMRYINCFSNTRGFQIQGTNNVVEKITSNPVSYYPFLVEGTGNTLNYCSGIDNVASYPTFTFNSGSSATFNYCFATGTKSTYVFSFGSSTTTARANNCCSAQANGFNINSPGAIMTNCLAQDASASSLYGYYMYSNTKLDTCSANNCYYGVQTSDSSGPQYLVSCSFTSCGLFAIYAYRTDGFVIENTTFLSNNHDVYLDSYTRDVRLINCSSTTPTNYFLYRAGVNGGKYTALGCSIDAPSAAKAYNVISGARYSEPEYLFQNSFGITGQVFANGSYVEDTTDFRTSSPSMKLTYNTTISGVLTPIKMASFYVAGGTAKTFSYYLKRDAGAWSGSIVPQIRLNGKLIKTGTTITSLNNDWNTSYTISATAGEITEDGELSLEFIYNANNVAIRIDDVTIS